MKSKTKLKIAFLTQGDCYSPSSRYRSFQYFPWLKREGIQPVAYPLYRARDHRVMEKLSKNKLGKIYYLFILLNCAFNRFRHLGTISHCSLVVLEHEVFSWLPLSFDQYFLQKLDKPFIVDYDDASYVKYEQKQIFRNKIPQIMATADAVIAGSRHLLEYSSQFNKNTYFIPTVIDLKRYHRQASGANDIFTIGWIGGPQNVCHIRSIAPALQDLSLRNRVILRCIGAPADFQISGVVTEVIPWSWNTEIEYLLSCDVGIAPLDSDAFSQAKCGFKIVQYMACGLPVVASPIGANKDIIEHGIDGFLALKNNDWFTNLSYLSSNYNIRKQIGSAGRNKIIKYFSVQSQVQKLINIYYKLL